ncbi:MAG TPA: tetratricopeptide repeat protein [Pirellulales bacterium]|nr:tetratricopeptide repeat protein [Pirellulales bacterium]
MRRLVLACLLFCSTALRPTVGVVRADDKEAPRPLVGTHVVSTPAEVRFVDAAGQPLGTARGGTVLDVLDSEGEMLRVERGWIKRSDVVPQGEAIEYFSEQLRQRPTAVAYASRARTWNYLGEYDKAIDDCDAALELDADCAMAYDRRAQALTAKGRVDEALADFERAIHLTPGYASAYSHRARAWLEKGEYDKSLADCDEALRLDSRIYLAHYLRGRVWTRRKAPDKAIASYSRAIDLNPHYVPALNARGNEWFFSKKFSEAEADYSAAIRLDPKFDIVHVHYNRGNARLYLGKAALAKDDYKQALKYDENYVPAMQGLAACFAAQNDYESAIEWQARAVKMSKREQQPKLKSVLAHYQAARKK